MEACAPRLMPDVRASRLPRTSDALLSGLSRRLSSIAAFRRHADAASSMRANRITPISGLRHRVLSSGGAQSTQHVSGKCPKQAASQAISIAAWPPAPTPGPYGVAARWSTTADRAGRLGRSS
jgi:hypothetical protein